jgi:glutamine cyclotransferase
MLPITPITTPFCLSLRQAFSRTCGVLALFLCLTSLNCQSAIVANRSRDKPPAGESAPSTGYDVVNTWPHDRDAYTQGLVFHDGKLLESTGEVGHSSLRRVELETGTVLQKIDVPPPYFAEGITLFKGKIYQLTWQHHLGFIYDASSFQKLGEFSYFGEGWGLTNDGKFLILSDGTNKIRFLDPDNFQVKKIITVSDKGRPVSQLNELEYVHNEIYANVWHDDRIARIDAESGRVIGWINLKGLLSPGEASDEEAVLNGIGYDEATGRLFVTGKLWPKLFEIRLRQ